MMNIGIISHLYPNTYSPAKGTFIRNQYLEISSRLQTHMLVPSVYAIPLTRKWQETHAPFISEREANRVRYFSIPHAPLPHITKRTISNAILRFLHKKKFDLIHFHWLFPDGLAIPAVKNLNIPTVLTIHGSDWYNTKNRPVLKKLMHESLTKVDAILTVGNKLKNDIIFDFPELEHKIFVSFNLVDFKKFQPPESRSESLNKLNWNFEKKHVLCVANINPEKGIDILIKAVKKLNRNDFILHIIGNIPNIRYSREVLLEIEKSMFVELHSPVSHDRIVDYFQGCDLMVLPSRREGFGLSLAEAIACGKPVISTKSGGPEDIVTRENGFLVDVNAPDQIAEKMESILSGSISFHSEQIRESIREKFHSDRIIDQIINIYEEIIRPF